MNFFNLAPYYDNPCLLVPDAANQVYNRILFVSC